MRKVEEVGDRIQGWGSKGAPAGREDGRCEVSVTRSQQTGLGMSSENQAPLLPHAQYTSN